MGRPKASKPAAAVEIEEFEDLEAEETEDGSDEDGETSSGSKPMSKAKAARAALEQGIESPQQAIEFIRKEFGIEMNPQHFSAVKSGLRKKEREAEATGRPYTPGKRGRRPSFDSFLAPPRPSALGVDADLLDAMEAIKPLIAALGADKVKRIVELLG